MVEKLLQRGRLSRSRQIRDDRRILTCCSAVIAPDESLGSVAPSERTEHLAGLAYAFPVGGIGLGAVLDVLLDGLAGVRP